MTIKAIAAAVERLTAGGETFDNALLRLRKNEQFSAEYKRAEEAKLGQQKRDLVNRELAALYGRFDAEARTWSGGLIPQVDQDLTDRFEAARREAIEGDGIDQVRLQNTIAGLRSRLSRFQTLPQIRSFYEQADPYTKRALQTVGPEQIARRFGGQDGASFAAKLERDHAAALETSDLRLVKQDIEQLGKLKWAAQRAAQAHLPADQHNPFSAAGSMMGRISEHKVVFDMNGGGASQVRTPENNFRLNYQAEAA